MSKRGKGVLMFDDHEPKISGYLIIGKKHYQIIGKKISDIRTHLDVRQISEIQEDLFDDRSSTSGARKRDSV